MLTVHIVTLFYEAIAPYLEASILGRAVRARLVRFQLWNLKDFAEKAPSGRITRRVDDKAYGGGPGMVLRAEPMLRAAEKIFRSYNNQTKPRVIIFSPAGKQFEQKLAGRWAKQKRDLILIAGRYEGVDARVKKILRAELVSIGPYVLAGGELPALVVAEAVARHLPGVLGDPESLEERRVASPEVYTRPEVLEYHGRRYRVPKVLLSGHHREIEEWRLDKKDEI